MKPKISLIMCTYNRIDFLKRSIESILNQSFKDFEFILVNNGSTDRTGEFCKKYSQQDTKIKYIHILENQGIASGRNEGLRNATGEYITFVDDDDYCEPEMLQFLFDLAYKFNSDISICGSWNDFGNRLEPYFIFNELMILDKASAVEELLKREKYNVAPPTKLFKRYLFDNITFKEDTKFDDIHITYKLFTNASLVVAKGIPLYKFRKHNGNNSGFIQTNIISTEILQEYLEAFSERTKYISWKIPKIALRAKYSEWSYMISMCDKIISFNYDNCLETFGFMIKTIKDNYDEIINCPFTTDREKIMINNLLKE